MVRMSSKTVTVEGNVTAEGLLEVTHKLQLPPGRVRVTVESVSPLEAQQSVLDILADVQLQLTARGNRGRTREEIDADVATLREEWEDRFGALQQHGDELPQHEE
jgi:hypothetical protein